MTTAEPSEMVAFVHIPKTAGGTVTTMFTAAYSKAGVKNAGNYMKGAERTVTKLRRGRVKGAQVAVGHVPFSVYRENLPAGTRYVTFLREPVDRVLSHYYRHLHRKNERAPERSQHRLEAGKLKPGSKAGSIEEALGKLRMSEIKNLSTRFLCSDPSPESLPPSALEEAKANLREFAFVGIQERFDESLALLQRRLELPVVPHGAPRHVSPDRPHVDEIPDAQRALILKHNELDAELYRYGLELFEEAVAAAGEGLEEEAARVRELSAANSGPPDTGLQDARAWLERELPAGSAKPKGRLLAAAEAEGIPPRALKHASRMLGVEREKREWIRPSAADATSGKTERISR